MFTGIIETTGTVVTAQKEGDKNHFSIRCDFAAQLHLGESVAHDGVCLTITSLNDEVYSVTAIDTTLNISNINWKPGDVINLERAMISGSRLDGHIVQGHVDSVGIINEIRHNDGSVLMIIEIDEKFSSLIVSKGSICLNGISLTIVDAFEMSFSVAIIPFTWEHTNMHILESGNKVNLEFDIIGKYVERMMCFRGG